MPNDPTSTHPGELKKTSTVGPRNQFPPALKAKIAAGIGTGMTIAQAAVEFDVSRRTISSFLRDPDFMEMVGDMEQEAITAVLQEVSTTVRQQIKKMGTRASEVLAESLESDDARVKLQAAGMVLRMGALQSQAEDRSGWEATDGNQEPEQGD